MRRLGAYTMAPATVLLMASLAWGAPEGNVQPELNRGPGAASLAKADRNGDGAVTMDELRALAPRFPKDRFTALDKNGDGKLTADELPKQGPTGHDEDKNLFKRADADANGQVTFDEVAKVFPRITPERFASLDADGDQSLSLEEVRKGRAQAARQNLYNLVRKADADGNGEVTFEEMQKVAPRLTRAQYDRLDRDQDGKLSAADRPGGSDGARGFNTPQAGKDAARKLMETDADGNGQVTFEEVTAAKPGFPRQAFDRFDVNKDGVLSRMDFRDRQDSGT